MRVELGLEEDRERRFALWTLMHMLGAAPDLDILFEDELEREAARTSWTRPTGRRTSDAHLAVKRFTFTGRSLPFVRREGI